MNKIKTILFLGMSLWGVACLAQVRSFTIGYNVGGKQTLRYTQAKENYAYTYTPPTVAFTVGYEDQYLGTLLAYEIGYARYSFDEYDLNYGNLRDNEMPSFNPKVTDDLNVFSFMGYWGTSLNSQKRLQFPMLAGVGVDYFSNALAHNFAICIGAKARVKFYITDNIALFAGANLKGGLGARKYGNEEKYSSDVSYNMYALNFNLDAGLYFNF